MTELPKWLTSDGTEEDMIRVGARILGHKHVEQATAPKPDPGPRVSRWRAQPPASVHWTREAWEAVYPDLAASWWKPWPDAPMPPQFDMPEFLRRMGQGPDKPALGRYVRDQYRAAHLAAEEVFMWGTAPTAGPQPIPCVDDLDDRGYVRDPSPGIVCYLVEDES